MAELHITNVGVTYLIRIITVFPITIGLCLIWNWLTTFIKSKIKTRRNI
jgi:hypothetical protein